MAAHRRCPARGDTNPVTVAGRTYSMFGIGSATMRFLEIHETRAHAIGGRRFRDLGDCVLLHSRNETEYLFNRVAAVRWPQDTASFDRRVAETIALFGGLGRRPYLWTAPCFNTPADLGRRLEDHGFVDQGGGYTMLLAEPAKATAGHPPPAGTTVEHVSQETGSIARQVAEDVAEVALEAFALPHELHDALAADAAVALRSAKVHFYLARVDGLSVAVGKRYTFDGASYFSAIGTRPEWQGRRLGELITRSMIRDALKARSRFTYLGVFTDNDRARELYERLGFAILGDRAADYLLL